MAEPIFSDQEMQQFAERDRVDEVRKARQNRIFGGQPTPSSRSKSPIEALMEIVQGRNSSTDERLGAVRDIADFGTAAQPLVKRLGIVGAAEPSSKVQAAIVSTVIAAGGPLAQDALKEIKKATISPTVAKAAVDGISTLRNQEATAKKQQGARKPSAL